MATVPTALGADEDDQLLIWGNDSGSRRVVGTEDRSGSNSSFGQTDPDTFSGGQEALEQEFPGGWSGEASQEMGGGEG